MHQFKRQLDGTTFLDLDSPGDSSIFIPDDMNNRDRVEMQTLLDAGEAELLPADPEPVDNTPTQAEEIAALRKAVRGDMTDLEALDARR